MSDSDPTVSGAATEKLVQEPAALPIPVSADLPPLDEKRSTARRKPLLTSDAESLPPQASPVAAPSKAAAKPSATSYIVKTNRPTNQRRGKSVLKLLLLVFLANLLLIGAFGAWYYNKINDQIESRFAGVPLNSRGSTSRSSDQISVPNSSNEGAAAKDNSSQLQQVNDKVADLQAQLLATQRRLAESEVANKAIISKLDQLSNFKPSSPAATSADTIVDSTELTTAAPKTQSAPLNDDLLLLKERNRLTAYADEAISSGSREPYDRLWKALNDPRLSNLIHAARSEILRVQNYYLSGSRLDRYDIPVAEYYPDSASLRDAQLNDEQLIRLLSNLDHPWEVRLKAANLLGTRRSTPVGDALVKTIKSDPNLDVVKEATFSFEQITGYHAQLFESKELDNWWKQYNESSTPPSPEKENTAAPAASEEAKDKNAAKTPAKKSTEAARPAENQPELKLPEGKPGDL